MALLQDLIQQIDDPDLRNRIATETNKLLKQKKFGLVFEEHLPECTPLYEVPVKVGGVVAKKTGYVSDIFFVTKIEDDSATCINRDSKEEAVILLDELVTVAQFGEPIYPYLKPIDTVCNAPDSDLWHTLIEADNYHALQLLEYLYAGRVDCIYIDPPYNTRDKDWKYNNDYVDSTDTYKHSKWLSMMEKRLRIARRLLAPDGAMITTIDDNEFSHLQILINEIFPDALNQVISIQMNPGGTQGKAFSVTNEYAIITYFKKTPVFKKQYFGSDTYNLRRWGSTSNRYEGATCFYPVILDSENNVIGFDDVLPDEIHPSAQVEIQEDGSKLVWPLDVHDTEKKWRYARATVEEVKDRMFVIENDSRIEIMLRRENEPPKTMWMNTEYSAEAYGTKLIKEILGKGRFSYPKSVYATKDCLAMFVTGKPNALILDFFAGSGTTLHAVNLLNAEDGGKRRCILVTNNEVNDPADRKRLRELGYQPGDPEWERFGIAHYVTWERTRCSILGIDVNEQPLNDNYITSMMNEKETARNITQIDFSIEYEQMKTSAKKKLLKFCVQGKLPQKLVQQDTRYIISEESEHSASILFDDTALDEWLEQLDGMTHITDFYIVTKSNKLFKQAKEEIQEVLGKIITTEPVTVPMSDGFKANAAFFKLGFLDKTAVALGRQFKELLPVLWMKANAVGKCPTLDGDTVPDILILPENHFAVLIEESSFSKFSEELAKQPEIDTVFIVTDSVNAYREMIHGMDVKHTYQLYRDYLDNFRINTGR